MTTTLNSCAGADIVSFPLRTSITDLESYYSSLENTVPNIVPTFTPRTSNPNFKDDTRSSGEIDESQNAISVTYKGNSYQLINAQITSPTHTDWIVNPNASSPIQNKIDFIVTLENMQDKLPRFVIIVLPIILDNTITVNNTYLQGLAYLSSDITYSLSSLYNGLNDYFYYTTCLAPHGDNAFVYVNRDGLKINSDLYQNLLATWTQQSLSSIQNRILDNLTPTQKALSKLFQNVKNATNLQEIQQQINNIQATAQTPVINSMVETWPRYSPPYDIILNVPSKTITAPTQSTEGFTNKVEGFQGVCSGANCFSQAQVQQILADEEAEDLSHIASSTKCVPLDLDDALDSSGNIIFDRGDRIGNIEANRKKLRDQYAAKQMTYVDLIKMTAPFFAVLFSIALIYYVAWPFIDKQFLNKVIPLNQPSPLLSIAQDSKNIGSYMVFGMIILFGGFLIGAAVARAY